MMRILVLKILEFKKSTKCDKNKNIYFFNFIINSISNYKYFLYNIQYTYTIKHTMQI